jgi:hypothetical protein
VDAQFPAWNVQELFGGLCFPLGIIPGSMAGEALAALAGLVKHLRRLNADDELATPSQMVRRFAPISVVIFSGVWPTLVTGTVSIVGAVKSSKKPTALLCYRGLSLD